MWPNGFGHPGNFQNDFAQVPFSPHAQQFFPRQGMMQYNNSNDEEDLGVQYQPELSFVNQAAFLQNAHIGAPFSPSPFMNSHAPQTSPPLISPRPPAQLGARAAELKAELLKRKGERNSSATPPVPTQASAAKQEAPLENSDRGPVIPLPPNSDEKREQDLNELISQYSAPQSTSSTTSEQEKKTGNVLNTPQAPTNPTISANLQAPSSKVQIPFNKEKLHNNEATKKSSGSRHASNGSVSEGEIVEDPISTKLSSISKQAKEPQPKTKMSKPEEQPPRNLREGQIVMPTYPRSHREESRRRTPPHSPRVSNGHIQHREEAGPWAERGIHRAESAVAERSRQVETERQQIHPRRESLIEENHQPQTNGTVGRAEQNRQARELNPPSLHDLISQDEDLREWLEITGFHNEVYRNKILKRRRAIAALDAQREKLLAEMAAEERGGLPPAVAQQAAPSMLPPPIPNKVVAHVEPMPKASVTEPQRDRVVSNKRPYSDIQDAQDAPNAEKMARVEEKSFAPRIKAEDTSELHRPRSRGFSPVRRFSPTRREESEMSHPRYDGRGRSRERVMSPGRRAYENRPAPHARGYDSDNYYDRDRDTDDRRPAENRGRYRGKDFDPYYRGGPGRGRGRGRAARDDSRDREYRPGPDFKNPDFKNDAPFGTRIATGRPYRDLNGFDRGGRGDTRYFIVKSFNEENVLKCIEESVWTTQVQNGPVFKEAFETCKNVILVFSINKSRAFQGYARMESLPGSVEVPDWQKAINWESAGAFRVRWLVICATRFHRVGHLKNAYNDNQAVLIGKDGQEIEENCGAGLIELIDEEADQTLRRGWFKSEDVGFEELY